MRVMALLVVILALMLKGPQDPCENTQSRMISNEKVTCQVAVQSPRVMNSRRWLIDRYLHLDFTTTQQRIRWIQSALSTKPDDGHIFMDVDFSNLREVNTLYKDKNFNTAIGNKHKEILESVLSQILKKWNLESSTLFLSDYKSYRIDINFGKRSATDLRRLEHDLGLAFEAANQIFGFYLVGNNLIPSAHKPQDWFRGGIGKTADQANYAARVSRDILGRNKLRKFSDKEIQEHLQVSLKWSEVFRQELAFELRGTGLFQKLPNGAEIPTVETFELLRKLSDPEDLKAALIKKFSYQDPVVEFQLNKILSTVFVEKLQTYKILVDTFSPSLMNAERKVASLESADHGGMVADFAGLGALNLFTTAEALTKSSDLDSMLINVRLSEQAVTLQFKRLLDEFDQIVRKYYDSTVSTGDDFVAILRGPLGLAQKKLLLNELANKTAESRKRIAFISDGVVKDDRNLLATHGESLEKEFRLQIEGKINPKKLNRILVGLDMRGQAVGNGGVKIILGLPQDLALTFAEIGEVNLAFQNSVRKFNQENKTSYNPEI
jgi:hypothetical protein